MTTHSKELALTIINTSEGYQDYRQFAKIQNRYQCCLEFLKVASAGARKYEKEFPGTEFTRQDLIECTAEIVEHYTQELAGDDIKPTLSQAFETVIELAEQNAIDPDNYHHDDNLVIEGMRQQESIAIIQKYLIDLKLAR